MNAFIATFLVIVLGVFFLYKLLFGNGGKSRMPGPKGYPVVGAALQLKAGRFHEQFSEFARQYGNVFEIQILNTTVVVLNKVDTIKKAFCSDGYKQFFNDRPKYFIGEALFEGNGFITRQQDKVHGDLRKVLTKGIHLFGDGTLETENIMRNEIHRVMKVIEEHEGSDFEVYELIKRSLSNMVSIVLIGEPATDEDVTDFFDVVDGQDYFVNAIHNTVLNNLPFLVHLPFYKTKYNQVMVAKQKILDKYFYRVKASRRPGKCRGLVDWYLNEQETETHEAREPLITDGVIKAAILEFISAGIITTASTLPSSILCLVNHPEYQVKIQEELDRVVPADREPAVTDRHNCIFLEAVFMETTRLLVSGPFGVPHLCSTDTEFEGYKIKGNTQVLINNWFIHHDEEVWDDPWTFRPERFLDENGKLLSNTHPAMTSWMPFGIGRRKCPGISLVTSRIFMYLSLLLRKWTFLPSPGKCGPCDPRSGEFQCNLLLMKPKHFYCIAKRRT